MDKISPKIIQFLQQHLALLPSTAEYEQERIHRQQAIDLFTESKGECAGYSILWSYCKRLSEQPKKDETVVRDDMDWFLSMQALLLNWDGETPFNEVESFEIERFIQLIMQYQRMDINLGKMTGDLDAELFSNNIDQSHITEILEDDKAQSPVMQLKTKQVFFTKEMLLKRLEDIIKPASMILLTIPYHMMAIYKNASDGRIFFYDLNRNMQDGQEVADTETLCDRIWSSSDPMDFEGANFETISAASRQTREVGFSVYNLDGDPVHQYDATDAFEPSYDEIVTALNSDIDFFNPHVQHGLVQQLTQAQQFRLLKDEGVSATTKSKLVEKILNNIDSMSPVIVKYIFRAHKEIIDDIQQNQPAMAKKIEKANAINEQRPLRKELYDIHYTVGKHAQTFIQLYEEGAIDSEDVKMLDAYDVIDIVQARPDLIDSPMVDFLLENCQTPETLHNQRINLWLISKLNEIALGSLPSGKIEYFGCKMGRFGNAFQPSGHQVEVERVAGFYNKLKQKGLMFEEKDIMKSKASEGSFSEEYLFPILANCFSPQEPEAAPEQETQQRHSL